MKHIFFITIFLTLVFTGGAIVHAEIDTHEDIPTGAFVWSGQAKVAFKAQFLKKGATENTVAQLSPDGDIKGTIAVAYINGGLNAGAGFTATYWDEDNGYEDSAAVDLTITYDSGKYGFVAEIDLFKNKAAGDGNSGDTPAEDAAILSSGPTKLYGWYKAANKKLHIEAAYKGKGTTWSVSDLVMDVYSGLDELGISEYEGWNKLDETSGLLFNYSGLSGLTFGVMFPFAFAGDVGAHLGTNVLVNTMLQSAFGAVYETGPLGLSVMLSLESNTLPGNDRQFGLYTHLGAAWEVSSRTTVSIDISAAVFPKGFNVSAPAGESFSFVAMGLGFNYVSRPISASAAFKAWDITTANDSFAIGLDLYGGLELSSSLTAAIDIGFKLGFGNRWKDYQNNPLMPDSGNGVSTYVGFTFEPSLKWMTAANAAMTFALPITAGNAQGSNVGIGLTVGFGWRF